MGDDIMNTRKSFYDVKSFYKKNAVLKAGFEGMRYQVKGIDGEEEGQKKLCATVWPEPFSFEKTPEDYKKQKEFSFDESGLDEAYEWVCQCFENDKDYWAHAKETPLQMAREMGIIE